MAILLGRNGAEPWDRIGWIDLSESPFRTNSTHARRADGLEFCSKFNAVCHPCPRRHFPARTYPRSFFCIYIVAASLIEGVVDRDV
jgi:hypothetical protein